MSRGWETVLLRMCYRRTFSRFTANVTVGGRADILINDDPISNMTCGTADQRQKSVDFYDLLQKIREVLGSFSVTVGTPWYADEDLYATLIARNEKEGNSSLAVRIDPIVTLKSYARHKLTSSLLSSLVPDDVESYLLPVRMPWRFVKKEIVANPSFALSQNFIIFPKGSEGVSIIFEEDDLRGHLRRRDFFQGAPLASTYIVLDRSFSLAAGSDFSFIGVLKCLPVSAREGTKPKMSMVLWDCELSRMKESQIIEKVVDFCERYKPIAGMIAQKDRGQEIELDLAIRKRAVIRGLPAPRIKWVPANTGTGPLQKAKRIKSLELPLSSDLLWFAAGPYDIDPIFEQFKKVGGGAWKNSNSSRHDDAPDGISLAWAHCMPRTLTEGEAIRGRDKSSDATHRSSKVALTKEALLGRAPKTEDNDSPFRTRIESSSHGVSQKDLGATNKLTLSSQDKSTPFGAAVELVNSLGPQDIGSWGPTSRAEKLTRFRNRMIQEISTLRAKGVSGDAVLAHVTKNVDELRSTSIR